MPRWRRMSNDKGERTLPASMSNDDDEQKVGERKLRLTAHRIQIHASQKLFLPLPEALIILLPKYAR